MSWNTTFVVGLPRQVPAGSTPYCLYDTDIINVWSSYIWIHYGLVDRDVPFWIVAVDLQDR